MSALPTKAALPSRASRLKVLALYGAIQALEWLVTEALHEIAGPAPLGNPALHEYLLRFQLGLVRAQGRCLAFVEQGRSS